MADALVVPGDAVLVRPVAVVLLRDEAHERAVRARLVAVCVDARHVDRDRVVVAAVLAERLAARTVEHDDAHRPGEADEHVVLAALVEMQASNDALARVGEVRLHERLRERARTSELAEPSTLVLVAHQLDTPQTVDHLFTPVARTKSFTW